MSSRRLVVQFLLGATTIGLISGRTSRAYTQPIHDATVSASERGGQAIDYEAQQPSALSESATAQGAPLSEWRLEARTWQIRSDDGYLSRAADQINQSFVDSASESEDSATLDLEEIPIVKDFLNAAGDFDLGFDLPFSVDVTSFMGAYGVVLSTDIDVSSVGNSPQTVAPIDR